MCWSDISSLSFQNWGPPDYGKIMFYALHLSKMWYIKSLNFIPEVLAFINHQIWQPSPEPLVDRDRSGFVVVAIHTMGLWDLPNTIGEDGIAPALASLDRRNDSHHQKVDVSMDAYPPWPNLLAGYIISFSECGSYQFTAACMAKNYVLDHFIENILGPTKQGWLVCV